MFKSISFKSLNNKGFILKKNHINNINNINNIEPLHAKITQLNTKPTVPVLLLKPENVVTKSHTNLQFKSNIEVYAMSNKLLNIELFNNKTIMIYSHFSNNGKIDSYNYYMINLFASLVDTVFVLSNLSKEKWSLPDTNMYVLNYDFKSDFSNLYVFLLRYQVFINKISRLFFINDSFLVANKVIFENKIKEDFFSAKPIENYQGLILSNEHNIHYQSYFVCVKHTIINKFIDYFKKNKIPLNHIDAINKYELGLSREFINKDITRVCYNRNPTALYPYEIIRNYGIIKRQQLLSTYNVKTQLTHNQIHHLKITYKDNNELIEYINNYS